MMKRRSSLIEVHNNFHPARADSRSPAANAAAAKFSFSPRATELSAINSRGRIRNLLAPHISTYWRRTSRCQDFCELIGTIILDGGSRTFADALHGGSC
jgi:hypothetical protein